MGATSVALFYFKVMIMKKIKLFLIRNYQRIIRFLISFSVIGCLSGVLFTASAGSVVDHRFYCSKPDITNNSCLIELVRADGKAFCIYVCAYKNDGSSIGDVAFYASVVDGQLQIRPSSALLDSISAYGVYWDNYGKMDTCTNVSIKGASLWLGGSSVVTGIHGYNVDVSTVPVADSTVGFVFDYGTDSFVIDKLNKINDYLYSSDARLSDINSKLDRIIAAIEANKSSAENNAYSGPSSDQKQAQSNLDSAESSINADTASARASTVDVLKNFTVPGDIMKGLLSVTNLFNSLCANIPFAPIVLNFSVAIGAAAFLLGLTAVFVRFGRSRK